MNLFSQQAMKAESLKMIYVRNKASWKLDKIMSYNDIYTETGLLMSRISLTFALVLLPRDEVMMYV